MKIPSEIMFAAKAHDVKKAWISDFEKRPGQCQNCGGTRIVCAFVATEGPYETPAPAYATRPNPDDPDHPTRITSKSEIINGQIRWWVGRTYSLPCPVCSGEHAQ